ncbi:MAG: Crp/Fnr family transcriptional regulator [Fermentimonas sp.]|jgi:CRP-like cAMP-binding protein|nr:Crp/Fnr family transcriptional regulator [Fermentimonas sp.]
MKNECIDCACILKSSRTLKDCQIEKLENNHVVVEFSKGDSIIKQGMFSTNIIFLRRGVAKIHITGPYHEQIVRLIKAPSYMALPTTIGNKINQYSVTAVLDSEVCFIDLALFNRLIEENKEFSSYIILELCKNELEAYRRCANRTQKQTRGNLADMLLEFSDHIFEADKFTLPISQSDIGNLVDASRESINRILSEFVTDGIIGMESKKVKILNKHSLQLISQNG